MSSSSSLEVYPLRLTRGQELKSALLQFAIDHNLSAPFVLTCCGSVSSATLRFAKPHNGTSEKVLISSEASHCQTQNDTFVP